MSPITHSQDYTYPISRMRCCTIRHRNSQNKWLFRRQKNEAAAQFLDCDYSPRVRDGSSAVGEGASGERSAKRGWEAESFVAGAAAAGWETGPVGNLGSR